MCCYDVLWLYKIVDQPQNFWCGLELSLSSINYLQIVQYSRTPNSEYMSNHIKVSGIAQHASS